MASIHYKRPMAFGKCRAEPSRVRSILVQLCSAEYLRIADVVCEPGGGIHVRIFDHALTRFHSEF